MLVYFIPLFGTILLSYIHNEYYKIEKLGLEYIIVAFACIIYCSGYMTGSDWRNYELIYRNITWENAILQPKENGFYLYMCLFKSLNIGFFPFLIFSKVVVFLILVKTVIDISNNDIFALFLLFGFANISLFIFVSNPLRFMIALGIVCLSYKYMIEDHIIKFLILILIAISFHISSIIMIPIYFIKNIKISSRAIIILFTIYYIAFSPTILLSVLEFLSKLSPIIGVVLFSYIKKTQDMNYSLFTIGSMINYILFLLIMYKSDKIFQLKNGRKIFIYTIIYFILIKLGSTMVTIARLALFVAPFALVSISVSLRNLVDKNIAKAFIIIYILLSSSKNIYNSYAYYPYTNYFINLYKGELPYEYRSNYNKEKYFERFNKYPEDWHEGIDYTEPLFE
jgi:hypothetical protein